MIDQSDHPEKNREKISEELSTIYDDLSSKYDRYIAKNEADEPNEVISKIIENYWDIPSKLIEQDLHFESERQDKLKIGIPDIPTYKIRFAIEEGSWSVLLRDVFRVLIRDEFNRLLSLEELIWETDAGTPDDLAYYLLELHQIAEKWIIPVFNYWKYHHDYGKVEDFAPLIIGAYHQTSVSRGNMMFDGGKRLFKAKMNKLIDIKEISHASNWSRKAEEILDEISEDADRHMILRDNLIITLALLQREIIIKNQQTVTSEDNNDFDPEFNWNDFEPRNIEEREEFSEFIIRKLYRRGEPEPLDAALAIIQNLMTKLEYSEAIQQEYKEKFTREINKSENQVIDEIQKELPKIFIKLKQEEKNSLQNQSRLQNIDQLRFWDSFLDNITRTTRITDGSIAEKEIHKSVISIYKILLDMRMDPINSANKILEVFQKRYDVNGDLNASYTSFIENLNVEEISNKQIDDLITSKLSELISQVINE